MSALWNFYCSLSTVLVEATFGICETSNFTKLSKLNMARVWFSQHNKTAFWTDLRSLPSDHQFIDFFQMVMSGFLLILSLIEEKSESLANK